jgi:uncharacterized protein (DUF58 family)
VRETLLTPLAITAAAIRHKRFGIAFGSRFFLLLLIGLLWLGPATLDLRYFYGMLLWDLLALAAWGIDLAKLPRPDRLTVTRSWNAPAALSVPAEIILAVQNNSDTVLKAVVVDAIPISFRTDVPELIMTLPRRSMDSKAYEIIPMKRGDAVLGSAYIRYQSFFRLAERWAVADIPQKVCVYPNLEEARQHSIYLIRSRQIDLERRYARNRGQGREFESLREYRDGDEYRNICWRASARRGKLIARQFQMERSQTIWLVIDSGRLMRTKVAGLSKLDYAVNAALSLGQVALGSGDRVGLLTYGRSIRHRILPNRGSLHLRTMIEKLAKVEEESGESNPLQAAGALLSMQTRRSLILWLTDLAETAITPEVIEAAGQLLSRHLVILVVIGQKDLGEMAAEEPNSIAQMYLTAAAQETMHRREVLLASLRKRGALALEVDTAQTSITSVNSYLEVKERNLL